MPRKNFRFSATQKFPVLPWIKLAFIIVFFSWMFQWRSDAISLYFTYEITHKKMDQHPFMLIEKCH